jgi:hypothetical protein
MIKQVLDFSRDELKYKALSVGYRVSKRKRLANKVLVNGSPKTGTTWVVNLIASIPGYRRVGNFRGDFKRYYDVQPGDVVHGHEGCTGEVGKILEENKIQVITTLRDPRDQLVSRVFHIKRDENHSWNKKLENLDLDESIMVCIEGRPGLPDMRSMIELAQDCCENEELAFCVKYEDLLADTIGEFTGILEYLQIDLSPGLIAVIVERNQFARKTVGKKFWQQSRKPGQADPESHYRKGISGDWKNHLKEEHIEKIKEVAGDKLIELGYESDFDWSLD